MADPQKPRDAEPKELHEYTPAELRDNLSAFDPQALAGQANPTEGYPDQHQTSAGSPPETTAEQLKRDDKASDFNNNPELDREQLLTRAGRGIHTHG